VAGKQELLQMELVEAKLEERAKDFLLHFNLLVEQARQFRLLLRQS
jgi:hypothetical protein